MHFHSHIWLCPARGHQRTVSDNKGKACRLQALHRQEIFSPYLQIWICFHILSRHTRMWSITCVCVTPDVQTPPIVSTQHVIYVVHIKFVWVHLICTDLLMSCMDNLITLHVLREVSCWMDGKSTLKHIRLKENKFQGEHILWSPYRKSWFCRVCVYLYFLWLRSTSCSA